MERIEPKWEGNQIIAGGSSGTREKFRCLSCGSPACHTVRQLGDIPYICINPERKNKIENIRKELRK